MIHPAHTQRPGLAYQHAFDWLAVHLHAAHTHRFTLCGGTEPFHHAELARRGLSNHRAMDTLSNLRSSDPVLLCIEPTANKLVQLTSILHKQSTIKHAYFVIAGPLSRFLAEHKNANQAPQFLDRKTITTQLKQANWTISEQVGFHGPAAIVWHVAGTGAAMLKRSDWQDRCHYKMRASFSNVGRTAALICLAAHRTHA